MSEKSVTSKTETNKSLIIRFYEQVYNGRQLGVLPDFVDENYIEHNPDMQSGRVALDGFLQGVFQHLPELRFSVARLVAEDNLVVAHTLMRKSDADRGTAIAEIFRLKNGKIVERWDVAAAVPEETRNGNAMV